MSDPSLATAGCPSEPSETIGLVEPDGSVNANGHGAPNGHGDGGAPGDPGRRVRRLGRLPARGPAGDVDLVQERAAEVVVLDAAPKGQRAEVAAASVALVNGQVQAPDGPFRPPGGGQAASVATRSTFQVDAEMLEPLLAEARRLRSGPNPAAFLAQLDAAFERAAEAALADPALAERSRRLRRIARGVVPERLHPAARQLAARADAAARRWPVLLRIGRELAAMADGAAGELVALEGPTRQVARRAEAAARANPLLYRNMRRLAHAVAQAAVSEQLPPAVRRAARLAEATARRLRKLCA
ncbi:MAG TPA: hypothetical protein VMD59_05905 [Acidimicrobiales bacterium]|nr:hypothetical protein [Acidimicrobiales bacterium]